MNLWNLLFGCWHSQTSRVFTLRNWRGKKETYIVCLSCGKPIAYDWEGLGNEHDEREQVLEFQEGR